MDKILKESLVYRFLAWLKKWFSKLIEKSVIVQTFLREKRNPSAIESSMIAHFFEWLLKWLRVIAKKLKLAQWFENSIFAKPIIWTTLTIAVAPVLPTMMVLLLVIASMLSLLLKASIDDSFTFQHYRIDGWIFAFAIVIAISSVISISTKESIPIALLMIAFTMFYFVVMNVVRTKKDIKMVLFVMVGTAVVTAIYGLYQYRYGDLYSQAWLDAEMFEDIRMRVYATLDNPNVYGEYLLLMIPLIASLLWTEKGWKKKIILLGALVITGIAMALTYSRGCWLGLVIAIAILALLIDKRFIFLELFALLLSPFILPETIMNRFLSIGNLEDSSTSYRVNIWMGTLAMLKDYWISGVGMGITSFNTIYPLYSYNNVPAPHSHNLYLQVIVEYGICGFIVMTGVVYHYFKSACISLKQNKNIVLAGLVTGMVGFFIQSLTDNTWYNYRVVLLFWIVIAITMVLAKINVEEKNND